MTVRPIPRFRVDSLEVFQLWGERDLKVEFHPAVSILIGPNGCGKTTVLNLLRYVLTGDMLELAQLKFDRITLRLSAFHGTGTKTVQVETRDRGLRFKISRKSFDIALDDIGPPGTPKSRHRMHLQSAAGELVESLRALVPAVWLPVARRLPIPDDEAEYFDAYARNITRRHQRLESVDQRLLELLRDLSAYRIRLDTHLARRYKQFERAVLSLILYSKEFDSRAEFGETFTEDDKRQLLKAFGEAGLLDPQMRQRIEEHFEAAATAIQQSGKQSITWEELLVIPLIPRTKEMVRLASHLEEQRVQIFSQLRLFEQITNGFLSGKRVVVHDDGTVLFLRGGKPEGRRFPPDQLSSGEKQILILLIEALLREGVPVVYVADEPELSLHVEWQEKLLESLVELAEDVQVIVATHSPDIVGPYRDSVIQMGASV
jgi:energy-coupling factor transporter ATP-binding protein EcfA2